MTPKCRRCKSSPIFGVEFCFEAKEKRKAGVTSYHLPVVTPFLEVHVYEHLCSFAFSITRPMPLLIHISGSIRIQSFFIYSFGEIRLAMALHISLVLEIYKVFGYKNLVASLLCCTYGRL